MEMPMLSIIIPVYNVEPYIKKCLDSLIKSIDSDQVEIICIDDGSTDQSGKICDIYQEKYTNVKVIHQKNKGVATARNTGLRHARGEYIAWVDSDDYVSFDWFRTIKDNLKTSPDLLIFDYTLKKGIKDIRWNVGLPSEPTSEEFIYALSCDSRVVSILMNKVIRHEFFTERKFDEKDIVLEDYHLLTYLAPSLKKIKYVPESLYFYVQRENSLVHTKTLERSKLSAEIAYHRYRYFTSLGYQVNRNGYIYMYLCFCLSPNAYKNPYEGIYKKYYKELADHFIESLRQPHFSRNVKIRLLLLRLFPQPFCVWVISNIIKVKALLT